MSNTTLTNIPSNLDIRVKEPSGGAPPTSGSGGPSPDRFINIRKKYLTITYHSFSQPYSKSKICKKLCLPIFFFTCKNQLFIN